MGILISIAAKRVKNFAQLPSLIVGESKLVHLAVFPIPTNQFRRRSVHGGNGAGAAEHASRSHQLAHGRAHSAARAEVSLLSIPTISFFCGSVAPFRHRQFKSIFIPLWARYHIKEDDDLGWEKENRESMVMDGQCRGNLDIFLAPLSRS